MKMQNFDEEEEDGEGNHHDYDIELLLQLDQLNDLDQSQLDEEQLEQLNDLLNVKRHVQRYIENGSRSGSPQTRQGALRASGPDYKTTANQQAKSKTVINSLGHTQLNAMFRTNDHSNPSNQRDMEEVIIAAEKTGKLRNLAKNSIKNHASTKDITVKGNAFATSHAQIVTDVQQSAENLQKLEYKGQMPGTKVAEQSIFKKRKTSQSQRRGNLGQTTTSGAGLKSQNIRKSVQQESASNYNMLGMNNIKGQTKRNQNTQGEQLKYLKYLESVQNIDQK